MEPASSTRKTSCSFLKASVSLRGVILLPGGVCSYLETLLIVRNWRCGAYRSKLGVWLHSDGAQDGPHDKEYLAPDVSHAELSLMSPNLSLSDFMSPR